MIRPGRFLHEVTSRAGHANDSWVKAMREPAASLPKTRGIRTSSRKNKLRKLLGTLILTRDLEIPGARALGLGLRLIPGKHALGGDREIPLVFQARFSSRRVGLVLCGHF